MRYWAYLAAKVVVAAVPLYGLVQLLNWMYPVPDHPKDLGDAMPELLHTLAMLFCFLICTGVLYVIAWDQRRRCRVCLRKLRMPIVTGSRGFSMLLGRPRIEFICPYGHGTLREDEQSGLAAAEWTPHSDNVWDELCAPSKDSGQDQ